jgi:hypothetical protein
MSVTDRGSEIADLEERVLDHLEDEAGHVEAEVDAAAELADQDLDTGPPPLRSAVAIAFPILASAVMVGGVFTGASARFYAGIAGLLGLGLAVLLTRLRRPWVVLLATVGGLFAIGALMVIPSGVDLLTRLRAEVSTAIAEGNVQRPPVPLNAGWQAIIGWIMGLIGFGTGWVALTFRRPVLALVLPLPVAAIAGISVPDDQQIASGLVVLVLFLFGLGLLSSGGAAGDGDERPPIGYEIRRAARSVPLIAVITGAMYLLAQTSFLFPAPYIDPSQEPQRPRVTPLSEVEDRVLFEVDSTVTGPWRIGSLDVYDGKDWRLPAVSESELSSVPNDGFVDKELTPAVRASFTVRGLVGAVLPGLPNPVGIIAEGPRLSYDPRGGNIRVSSGSLTPGQRYTVAAAGLPSIDELKKVAQPIPPEIRAFLQIPAAPPAAQALIDEAKRRFDNEWERFDYLRTWILDNIVAAGVGQPASIPPARIQEIVSVDKKASPFEIVAAQAMMARWVGVPSRIGYGFDGGDDIDGVRQVRPKHGATFVEVYFPGYKWLPVIGTPKKAEPTVGGDPSQQQVDPNIAPSDDAAVQLFVPEVTDPASVTTKRVLLFVLLLALLSLLVAILYALYPIVLKGVARSRLRSRARAAGPTARIAVAYAEWRDLATDYGFSHPTDTPLMFLDRMVADEEHNELAWLTTRALWGDLQQSADDDLAGLAEELSRNLRARLAQAQPATVRAIAAVSRLSLKRPFAPALSNELHGREATHDHLATS